MSAVQSTQTAPAKVASAAKTPAPSGQGESMSRKKTSGIDAITAENVKPITARRFIAARKLSGLDQQQAAARLGYRNSSQLSKIESGQSGAAVYVIQRAAIAYGVSMEFLTGLSDYPERDAATGEQLAIMRSLRSQLWEATKETLSSLQIAGSDTAALMSHIDRMHVASGNAWSQMCRHEKLFDAALEASPDLKGLPEDVRYGLLRAIRKMFADALVGLKASMEVGIEHAESAHRYLKRRQSLRAHEYMDDVETNYPLLAAIEGGSGGAITMRFAAEAQLELTV
jgi:transcriptional regulator with XRE-family HTH domain